MPYKIAFDIGHKPRGKLDENLTELRDFLNNNGFICYNFLETPITHNSLKPFDVLVFACPDFSKVSSLEISEISSWVHEEGGGLLLLSHAGGDRGRNSNLSELSQNFGILFENDQVLDNSYNLGMENMPIITSFIPPHPITNGITSLCYRSGCSLTIVGTAFSIASSNETSEPFSTPLVCVAEPEKGRVCAIGSYEMFRDRIGGGFNNEEHPSFAYNLFSWLISDYRMELHSSGAIPEITPQEVINPPQSLNSMSMNSELQNLDISFPGKISGSSDLIGLLKLFQSQINVIKGTIDKLVDSVMITQENKFERKVSQNTPSKPIILEESKSEEYLKKSFTPGIDDLLESNGELSELPPKPQSFKKSGESISIALPSIDDNSELKSAPKLRFKKKTKKEDLIAEKNGLEDKLNSIKSLINFMDKKLKAGSIDKKSYEKRITQLKTDLKKVQSRIEEINKEL
ncbi:MAG: hypothetical protein EAX89_10975 [Candidatus Lokiarchaeota archaeon]|nr:hypothetical protein [Candidatus Lokiarchaeota archaeon]